MQIEHLTRELGGRNVLRDVSFTAHRGQVTGIVGPNGSGKTTLLRIIAGELAADSGRIAGIEGARIAYLPQSMAASAGAKAAGQMFGTLDMDAAGERLRTIAETLASETDPARQEALAADYDQALAALTESPADDPSESRTALGLREIPSDTPLGSLSGGELTKLGLARVAALAPGVVLLDEPTNHLDLPGIAWVERYLAEFEGVAIVVSHDRALLDAVAAQIVELDAATGQAETFAGNYSAYANEKARREEEAWERYRREQREERRLKQTISEIESRARSTENRTIDFYFRKRAAKVARRAVTLRARLERQLDSAMHAERPGRPLATLAGSFHSEARGAARLLVADNVALQVGERTLFRGLSFEVRRGARTVLAGANGAGKTTLLRAIVGEHPVSAGLLQLSGSAVVGYLPQAEGELDRFLGPGSAAAPEALRRQVAMTATDAANFLHRFLIGQSQLSTPIGRLSFGERRRLALAILVARGSNLLLLDEPTNHLDVPSREAFESAFETFTGAALVVTHDRYFMERFADEVVEIGEA